MCANRPPGTELNILNGVNLSLREKNFGLIFGKSGSGKTTLLQLLAGLIKPTSGSICIQRYEDDGQPKADSELLPIEKVGIVFQFPERFFVADNVLDEITFGWPRQKGSLQLKEHLTSNLQRAFNWVGLDSIPLGAFDFTGYSCRKSDIGFYPGIGLSRHEILR